MAALRSLALFIYTQPGCTACSKARSHIDAFKKGHPTVIVSELNIAAYDWRVAGRKAKATPQYLFKSGAELVFEHVGMLTTKQLDRIYKEIMQ
jgi:hypothetical protein